MKHIGKVHKDSSSNVQPDRKGMHKEQLQHETYKKGEQERCIKKECNTKHTGKVQQVLRKPIVCNIVSKGTVCIVSSLLFWEIATWMITSVENSLLAFSKGVAKLLLQLHFTIVRPFSTIELHFTVTQNRFLSPSTLAFHVVCTAIISIKTIILNYAIFCIFNLVNENWGSARPEKQWINAFVKLRWETLTVSVNKHGLW